MKSWQARGTQFEAEKQKLLDDLWLVGAKKPLGYLASATLVRKGGESPFYILRNSPPNSRMYLWQDPYESNIPEPDIVE